MELGEIENQIREGELLPQPTEPQLPNFSEEERELTAWFFLRLQTIWGAKYSYPDERTLQLTKREWCKTICQYSKEDLHRAFEEAKRQKILGHPSFLWPEIPTILGLIRRSAIKAHRPYIPPQSQLEDPAARKAADKAARKALTSMRETCGLEPKEG